MKICNHTISSQTPYVIAEIGNNHNGSFDLAIKMIDGPQKRCSFVKFQMRNLASLYRKETLAGMGDDLSAEYTIDLLRKFELTIDEHKELKHYCDQQGTIYLCTP